MWFLFHSDYIIENGLTSIERAYEKVDYIVDGFMIQLGILANEELIVRLIHFGKLWDENLWTRITAHHV